MTSQSLYRKWRSKSFSDILGQDHVIRTLQNAVRHDRVAHAYLFTGPRGTGKTSTARVMAKAVNCLNPQDGAPCGECSMCLEIATGRSPDIIEIDGASNTGIDDIRALRERAAYAPAEGRFKVYIIDEVHRLSPNAFDGLLKTLEEPPPHVLFIFASTEPHKLPMTILSRCQRFDFHKIDRATTMARLREVAANEGLTVDDPALVLISQHAAGSLRDALGVLDQVRSFAGETITIEDVRSGIGLGRPEIVELITEAMLAGASGSALKLVHDASEQGIDPRTLSRQVIEFWRELLLFTVGAGSADDLDPLLAEAASRHASKVRPSQVLAVLRALTEEVIEPRLSVSPELPLEIAITQAILLLHPSPAIEPEPSRAPVPSGMQETRRAVREDRPGLHDGLPADGASGTSADESGSDGYGIEAVLEAVAEPKAKLAVEPPPAADDRNEARSDPDDISIRLNDAWPLVIDAAGGQSKTLQGLLRDVAAKTVVDSEVTLGFRYPFHRDQSDKPENRAMTERIIEEVLGQRMKVRCVRMDPSTIPPPTDELDAFVSDVERALRSVHAQQYRSTKPDGWSPQG